MKVFIFLLFSLYSIIIFAGDNICPSCQFDNLESNRYCINCGNEIFHAKDDQKSSNKTEEIKSNIEKKLK